MRYREYLPSPALQPYVDCYWYHEFDTMVPGEEPPVQRCLPLGTAELIVQLNGKPCYILNNGDWYKSTNIYFTGLYTDTAFWKTDLHTPMFGIRLKPESLTTLFNLPVASFLNSVIDAEAVLHKTAETMFNEMAGNTDIGSLIKTAERFLLHRLSNLTTDRNYVAEACRLIRNSQGGLSVEALSETLFISQRQLQRSFKEQVGASPKTYQRIIRFRNAYQYARKRAAKGINWSDVSYESGYADQAHFIRDFRQFTGDVPSVLANNDKSFFQTLEAVG